MDVGDMESSEELWERICAGLAAQTRDGNETEALIGSSQPAFFSEIFNPIPGKVLDVDSVTNSEDQTGVTPWTPLADSQQYLAVLGGMVSKFADDTKVGGVVDSEEGGFTDRIVRNGVGVLAFMGQYIVYKSWEVMLQLYRTL
eukprot:g33489.t1